MSPVSYLVLIPVFFNVGDDLIRQTFIFARDIGEVGSDQLDQTFFGIVGSFIGADLIVKLFLPFL